MSFTTCRSVSSMHRARTQWKHFDSSVVQQVHRPTAVCEHLCKIFVPDLRALFFLPADLTDTGLFYGLTYLSVYFFLVFFLLQLTLLFLFFYFLPRYWLLVFYSIFYTLFFYILHFYIFLFCLCARLHWNCSFCQFLCAIFLSNGIISLSLAILTR